METKSVRCLKFSFLLQVVFFVLSAQSGQIITLFAFILQDYYFKTSSAFSSTFLPLIFAFLIMVLSGLFNKYERANRFVLPAFSNSICFFVKQVLINSSLMQLLNISKVCEIYFIDLLKLYE